VGPNPERPWFSGIGCGKETVKTKELLAEFSGQRQGADAHSCLQIEKRGNDFSDLSVER